MIDYYDRNGEPMDMLDPRTIDADYKRIDATTLPDGKWVSTVWLGLNHRWDDGPPLIFESMLFESEETLGGDLDVARYATEAEARAGHADMVARWTADPDRGGE